MFSSGSLVRMPSCLPNGVTAFGTLGNDVFLSVASVWEAMVKYYIGKLPLPHPPEHYLPMRHTGLLLRGGSLFSYTDGSTAAGPLVPLAFLSA